MIHKKRNLFKGTDAKAFNTAGRKGKTRNQKSAIYYKEKRKNKIKGIIKGLFIKPKTSTGILSKKYKSTKNKKYKQKDTIFDLIRKNRSPKFLSNLANTFSSFVVKSLGRNLSDREKDLVRSIMSLVVSETLKKALEKPLAIMENIKMFIKVGQVVYKLVLKYDEYNEKFVLNENNIYIVDENNIEYKNFLLENPKVAIIKVISENEDFSKCPICKSEVVKKIQGTRDFYVCSHLLSDGSCNYTSSKCIILSKKEDV